MKITHEEFITALVKAKQTGKTRKQFLSEIAKKYNVTWPSVYQRYNSLLEKLQKLHDTSKTIKKYKVKKMIEGVKLVDKVQITKPQKEDSLTILGRILENKRCSK